jgi:uroporphyrinogen-III synthase
MTTVLVTRPAGGDDPLVAALESRGYQVVAVPTLLVRRLSVAWPDLSAFDWIIVTSAAGVATLPEVSGSTRWAAVGQATARALQARGIEVELVPAEANGLAIAAALPDPGGKRVLLVRGALAGGDLPDALRRRGVLVQEVTTYQTIEGPAASAAPLRAALAQRDLAAVVFASGSAVRGYLKLGGRSDLPAITIGPRTTAVARQAGFTVLAEADGQNAAELADATERAIPIEVKRDA